MSVEFGGWGARRTSHTRTQTHKKTPYNTPRNGVQKVAVLLVAAEAGGVKGPRQVLLHKAVQGVEAALHGAQRGAEVAQQQVASGRVGERLGHAFVFVLWGVVLLRGKREVTKSSTAGDINSAATTNTNNNKNST